MKKYNTPVLVVLLILLILFQIAIWMGTPEPSKQSTVMENFWFLLKVSVPILLAFACMVSINSTKK